MYEVHPGIVFDFYLEVELIFASRMNISHVKRSVYRPGPVNPFSFTDNVGTDIFALLSEQGGPSKLVQKHLAGLFNSITSFYHPSNNGRWLVSNVHFFTLRVWNFLRYGHM